MRDNCTPSDGGRRPSGTETRAPGLQRAQGDCAPSEGEAKTREICTPSEGGKRRGKTKTRVQKLQRTPDDCAPSKGETETREICTPSEGGTGISTTPSEGVRKWQGNATLSEGVVRDRRDGIAAVGSVRWNCAGKGLRTPPEGVRKW